MRRVPLTRLLALAARQLLRDARAGELRVLFFALLVAVAASTASSTGPSRAIRPRTWRSGMVKPRAESISMAVTTNPITSGGRPPRTCAKRLCTENVRGITAIAPDIGVQPSFPSAHSRTDFCACRRFSASSQISDCGPSITPSTTSSPRWAGRQWRNLAPGLARCISASVT